MLDLVHKHSNCIQIDRLSFVPKVKIKKKKNIEFNYLTIILT